MKINSFFKVFTFLLALASMPMRAADIVINVDPITCADDWSAGWLIIDKSEFSMAQEGDEVLITVTAISPTCSNPTIYLQNGNWGDFTPSMSMNIKGMSTPFVADFTLTENLLNQINQTGSLIIKGIGYTMENVTLHIAGATQGAEGSNVLWEGRTEMPMSWGAWVTVNAPKFATVLENWILRLYVENVQPGAMGRIQDASWEPLPDADTFPEVKGSYFQYDLTPNLLSALKKKGLIVSGCGYTLLRIEAIDPASLPNIEASVKVNSSNYVWEAGELPNITLNLKNTGDKDETAKYEVMISTDAGVAVAKYTKECSVVKNSSSSVNIDLSDIQEPGIYTILATVSDLFVGQFNIAYDPRGIISAPDAPADFSSFWSNTLEELASIDGNFNLTKLTDKSTNQRNVWLVEMNSLTNDGYTPVVIRAYYAEPTAAGKYPCAVHFQGYDSDSGSQPWVMGGNDHNGWCDLIVSMRGQMVNNRDPYREENAFYGDWFAYNFGNVDAYYYRGAYADAVRALDFLATREKVDQDNIFAQGSSQGGAFTLIAAALAPNRLKAIAPSIQFMGDFPDYFQRASWPASVALSEQSKIGMSDEEMYEFLSYFDTKNFADRIKCPVISNISLQDNICPPHTNLAPINNLSTKDTDIELIFNPTLQHAVPDNWWNTFFGFFERHINSQAAIENVSYEMLELPNVYYNAMGQRVEPGYKGLVICNGKKSIWK